MSDVLNPVGVEQAIRDLGTRISGGVRVVSERYADFLAADRAYNQAFARAYLAAQGAVPERKYIAELATIEERERRDATDVLYRYADRTAKALEYELRGMQSIGASVRSMYSAPQGVGR